MTKIGSKNISCNARVDIAMELKLMMADLRPVCPVESPEFNQFAIAWIEKNAAAFRKKWERCHVSGKGAMAGNFICG